MPLKTSQILQNRYRIVSMLGQGGMGAVYKAWNTRLNVHLAIKEMIPQPDLDQETLEQLKQQFLREAQTMARLNHPNLVRVIDYFEEDDKVYLVMDFVDGEELSECIARGKALPEDQVLEWTHQLLNALTYCHSQGVIHRDIKPQNVIIRPDGRAVLVDFGLVKLWDPNDPHTRTAMRGMGTPEYAPPEQYGTQSGHTDPRSDVYGLGATIYHALTGQAPPTATMRIASPRSFQTPRALNPNISPVVEAAVLRATELAVESRFASPQEMAAALKGQMSAAAPTATVRVQSHVQTSAGTAVMPGARVATGVQPAPATRRRRVPVWVWALGGLAIVAVVVVLALLSQIGPASPSESEQTATAVVQAAANAMLTPSPSPVPSPLPSPTETPTPTSTNTPTNTPSPTDTPKPTSTPVEDTPTPSPTPTPEPPTPTNTIQPTSPPAAGATATPVPAAQPTTASVAPTSVPPPPGEMGRIFFTINADPMYYLATADPSWTQGQIVGATDAAGSTCAGGATARTLVGQNVNLYYGSQYRCTISHPKECPAPNGVYKVTLWETDGNFSMGINRVDDNSFVRAIYNGPLNRYEPIMWAPDSSRFYFTIGNTLHSASPEVNGYQPILSLAYEPYMSPDGSMILYLQPAGTGGARDIWVVNADGSDPRNVSNAPDSFKECARWGW